MRYQMFGWAMVAGLAGCQQVPAQYAAIQVPQADMRGYYQPQAQSLPQAAYALPPEVEPAAGPAPAAQSHMNEIMAEVDKMSERVQRVEKAMLRLDRRMQLVERNELNRMGGGEISAVPSETPVAQVQEIGPAYTDGFRPVAITSSLQAAPSGNTQMASAGPTRARGLPSLADPSAAPTQPESELAVWTIRYGAEKVWPERDQLPLSRDVVEALRIGKNVTVFARGKYPQAVEFRERVRALSRYLGKVASLESVPIAAIPAAHLDDNTIEIFATH